MCYSYKVILVSKEFETGDRMSLMLDIGVVALLVLFIYSGVKRGIIYMAINAGGSLLASVIAPFIASMLSLTVYNSFVKENIINGVNDATKDITTTDTLQKAQEIIDALSNFSLNAFSFLGIDSQSLAKELSVTRLDPGTIVESMIRVMAVKMISTVLTFVFFLILMFIVSFLAAKFTKAVDRTMLSGVNRACGAIVGVVEALLIIMILSLILYFVMMFLPPDSCKSLNDAINNSWLYKFIYNISLPDKIISMISLG